MLQGCSSSCHFINFTPQLVCCRDGLAARLQRALAVWQSDDVIRRHQAAGTRSNHITARCSAATNANTGGSGAKDKSVAISCCIAANVKCNDNYVTEDTARDNTGQRFAIGKGVQLYKLTTSNTETSQCHGLRNVSSSADGKPASSNSNYNSNILLNATSTVHALVSDITAKGRLPRQSCSTSEFQIPLTLKKLFHLQTDPDTTSGFSPRTVLRTANTAGIVDTRPPEVKMIRNSLSCGVDNNMFWNGESNARASNLLGESCSLQPSLTSSGAAVLPTSSRTHPPTVNALKSSLPARDNNLRHLPFMSSKTGTVMETSKSSNKKAVRTLHILIESMGNPMEPLPPNAAMARLLNIDDEEESRSSSMTTHNARNINRVAEENCSVGGGVGHSLQGMMKAVTLINDATGESKSADGNGDQRSRMNEDERNGRSVISKCDASSASPCRPSDVLVFFLVSLSKRLQPGDAFTILPPWLVAANSIHGLRWII